MLTELEKELVMDLALVWNKFLLLPKERENDAGEFNHHLHILQRQILARSGRREINELENTNVDHRLDKLAQ